MFSILKKNTSIAPEPTQNCNSLKQLFTPKDKIVFIHIEGVGTNQEDLCRKLFYNNKTYSLNYEKVPDVLYEYVNYGSKSVFKDLLSAIRDMKTLASSKTYINLIKEENVEKLKNVILKYIENEEYKDHKIVLIGVSHGSLIIHKAIIDMQNSSQNFNRLYIFTLGSPRYLPKNLLENNDYNKQPKVINFYNVKDQIVKLLSKIQPVTKYIKVPNKQFVKDSIINEYETIINEYEKLTKNTKYCYQEKDDSVFVLVNIDKLYNKDLKNMSSVVKNHASIFNLFPIISYFHLHNIFYNNLLNNNSNNGYILEKCITDSNNNIRGGSVKYLTYLLNKKQYVIKQDEYGKYILYKKQKVYLKDIKGKYRYVR